LHAHHRVSFSELLNQFKRLHPDLALDDQATAFRAALKFEPFWDISNGETLCVDCHSEHHPNLVGTRRRIVS
jgi:hypothetical protein